MSPAAGTASEPARRALRRGIQRLPTVLMLGFLWATPAQAADQPVIDAPLTSVPGDKARGQSLLANRSASLCLLCHSGPVAGAGFQGNLAPDLAGAGARFTAAQLRQRLVDSRRLNPQTIMPPYFATDGLNRVGSAWQGQTLLDAQQIEDLIAYLLTLR